MVLHTTSYPMPFLAPMTSWYMRKTVFPVILRISIESSRLRSGNSQPSMMLIMSTLLWVAVPHIPPSRCSRSPYIPVVSLLLKEHCIIMCLASSTMPRSQLEQKNPKSELPLNIRSSDFRRLEPVTIFTRTSHITLKCGNLSYNCHHAECSCSTIVGPPWTKHIALIK